MRKEVVSELQIFPAMAGLPFTKPKNQNRNPIPVTVTRCTVSSVVTTLLIRHFPEAIPEQTLSRLFSHHGASSVRPCASTGRLRFLGKVLKVERASKQPQDDNKLQHCNHEVQLEKDSMPPSFTAPFSNNNKDNVAEQVSKSGLLPAAEPIAPRLGYAYPPPDGNILINIVNALVAVP